VTDGPSIAANLGRAFDLAFVERTSVEAPRGEVASQLVGLLGLRVAGDRYGVPIADIVGLLPKQTIVALPSAVPELLGIAGVRGGLMPVYSLGALLGYRGVAETCPWIIVVGAERIGLAFETFEGYLRVSSAEIAVERDAGPRPHVAQTARLGDSFVGIVDLRSIQRVVEEKARGGQG
jgi:purine-binding chemotaxis protein CheW